MRELRPLFALGLLEPVAWQAREIYEVRDYTTLRHP